MPKLDLFTVFSAALDSCRTPAARSPGPPAPAPSRDPMPDADVLLVALRNSTTGRDQIMQRRLGSLLDPDPLPGTSKG